MLPENIHTGVSILENENAQINLVRWMHQCELMKRYFEADVAFVAQQTDLGFEIIVSSINDTRKYLSGTLYNEKFELFTRLANSQPEGINLDLSRESNAELPRDLATASSLLSRPILWPDGTIFGCLCVINPASRETASTNAFMLEPFQVLLQQDLALLCQSQRIESLSMRDRDTGMLNHYGFIMMAPRQLNLGRRFGAHAGILFFELYPNAPLLDEIEDKHIRLLGNIIQDTIRTADIAAHYSQSQFVVLAFVDAERDLGHISRRVEKLLMQQNDRLKLDSGHSFFAPDSSAKLAPMLEQAKRQLKSQQKSDEDEIATEA
ncbi:GGDEF domain-containing protein [Shewanella insulae]|uniref:GGDEF domain-containing protein n=1 Tax=Shewanella insulae TaxID=2681496 RepID=A0A6L7I395_9GAMM|nr:GGDEF domain-containing protein [Shewanella insulae]MCG9713461.1 GGDEF domain-containing protein [Shewanella insulae]MCG9754880.1 GGDEF domain-containing protein [Shewanella insulae]MXR70750.1 GGDEF domain-containing protein [Shewanella insulae]